MRDAAQSAEGRARRWTGRQRQQHKPPHPALPPALPCRLLQWCSGGAAAPCALAPSSPACRCVSDPKCGSRASTRQAGGRGARVGVVIGCCPQACARLLAGTAAGTAAGGGPSYPRRQECTRVMLQPVLPGLGWLPVRDTCERRGGGPGRHSCSPSLTATCTCTCTSTAGGQRPYIRPGDAQAVRGESSAAHTALLRATVPPGPPRAALRLARCLGGSQACRPNGVTHGCAPWSCPAGRPSVHHCQEGGRPRCTRGLRPKPAKQPGGGRA